MSREPVRTVAAALCWARERSGRWRPCGCASPAECRDPGEWGAEARAAFAAVLDELWLPSPAMDVAGLDAADPLRLHPLIVRRAMLVAFARELGLEPPGGRGA